MASKKEKENEGGEDEYGAPNIKVIKACSCGGTIVKVEDILSEAEFYCEKCKLLYHRSIEKL